MNKSEIRAQLANDLVAFSQLGGEITTIRPQQVRTKNTAACRYRRGQSYKGEGLAKSEPKSLRSWCYWGGKPWDVIRWPNVNILCAHIVL